VKISEDGKQIGHVTNFLEHQRINRPTASKHSRTPHARLTEPSVSAQESLTASSLLEGKGTGNREGKGVVSADADEPQLTLGSPADPPQLPPAGLDAKKKKGGRERNEVLDALAVVGGGSVDSVTAPMWGEAAKALKDIREVCPDVTAAMIQQAAKAYRDEWKGASLSPSALAKHWQKFGPQKKEGAAGGFFIGIAEPEGDWRAEAEKMGIPVAPGELWSTLERAWRVQIYRRMKEVAA
jgi:hypothetical protein